MSNGRGAGGGQHHNALSSGSGSASSASSVGSMLLDTFAGSTKTPKLRVSALSDLVILHPNREDREVDDIISGVDTRPQGGASAGALIEGTVVLILPSAKKVDKLKVELIGKQSVWLKPAFESYDTIHHTAKLDTGPQILCPGEHSFKFSFVVPDDSGHSRTVSMDGHITSS